MVSLVALMNRPFFCTETRFLALGHHVAGKEPLDVIWQFMAVKSRSGVPFEAHWRDFLGRYGDFTQFDIVA